MISREELRDAQERVTKLEKLLGSNTLVLDSKQEEVERETLYSRLNKISQLHKVIMDRDKNKPISEFLTLCRLNWSNFANTRFPNSRDF